MALLSLTDGECLELMDGHTPPQQGTAHHAAYWKVFCNRVAARHGETGLAHVTLLAGGMPDLWWNSYHCRPLPRRAS